MGRRSRIRPEYVRALHHHAGGLVVDQGGDVFGLARRDRRAHHHARQIRHRLHGLGIMGMQAAGENGLGAPRQALRHQHRFGGGGRAVIERGIRHLHAGQQRHLGLEFEQHLQRALRDLRLIGRVGGEKFRTLDQVIDRAGHMMLVGARAAEERHRACRHIAGRQFRQRTLHLHLALGFRQIEGRQRHHRLARHIPEQRVDIGRADLGQHGAAIVRGQRQVTHDSNVPSRIPGMPPHPSAWRIPPCR